MVKTIQKRAKAKLEKNKEYTCGAVVYSQVLFMKVYDLLSHLANVTSDSVCVYLKLFSVTDANQRRLVRFKMSIIFKPNIRQAFNQNTSDSSQGIFGGDSHVFKNLEENKLMSTLLKSVMLQTKRPGKLGKKPGMKGGKKPAPRGSKGQGKKTLRRSQKREPTRTLTTPRTKRLPKRRTRRLMNHVS